MKGFHERDRSWMLEAVRLGERGRGRTRPNPAVGAVVVRRDRLVGRGFHRRAGGPHAEVFALRQAGAKARGATLYVTLEPCAHEGRTGPCVEAILAAGCSRVVVGVRDPNPRVDGRGLRWLRREGVEVVVAPRIPECSRLIEDFQKRVTTGLPFVTLKLATTLDGRIATAGGESRWITGPASRRLVHEIRNRTDAILTGSGTVLADDPELTCRLRGGRTPLRVVLDGRGRVPPHARVFDPSLGKARCYTRSRASRRLQSRGVDVRPGGGDRRGQLEKVLRDLGREGIGSVLVEGGRRLASRALDDGLVDRVLWFSAPKIFGQDGLPGVGTLHVQRLSDAIELSQVRIETLGTDVLVEGVPSRRRPSVTRGDGVA